MRRSEGATSDPSQIDPDTRERIEQAVLDIFSEREFHRVGLIEIARGANVSLQTIYKYYGSKEALLFSTLDTAVGRLSERLIDHLQGIQDHKERLRKVFWVALDFIEKNPRLVQLQLSSVYINTWRKQGHYENPELFGTFIRVLADGRAEGVLTDEVDERVLLDYIVGILFRLGQTYVQRGMKHSLTRQANALFEMVWRAIAKPG